MASETLLVNVLREGWTLTHLGGEAPLGIAGATIDAEVPGSTHTDLLRAGLIQDPYFGTNEAGLEWMWRCSWRYATNFAATEPTEGERIDLVFDGLDTVATIRLNGTELGRTANMHRGYRFDVRSAVTAGDNLLEVDFASALAYAEAREAQLGPRPRAYPHPFNAIRKMACSFGWDWGPDLQTAGIWKGVRLERWHVARFASVRPLVTLEDTTGVAVVHVEVERASDAPLTVVATVAGVEATAVIEPGATTGTVRLEVPRVAAWWTAGYGEPALHRLVVELHSPDQHLDTFERRVGFRSVELDTAGGGFTFVINGRPVFVKGANWIPADHLLTRVTRAGLERLVGEAVAANLNLLRVWGGGIFESDDFYEACAERGVMVWQDFPFACAAYSEDAETLAEVAEEARQNVSRLAPHPALVHYNGSNENVWGFADWGWEGELERAGVSDWGLKIYEDVLPAILAELDPTRPYSPSSPFSTAAYDPAVHPNAPGIGTAHEWDVWNRVDYSHYADAAPRFVAEFGFQGPATWATLRESMPADGFSRESATWLAHQKAEDGNGKLERGYAPHLPDSDDFETWHWITSLNQARAVRFGLEHYRSHWPHTAGAIVWQLNDCWPVTSWAAIDGAGRRKPLYYALAGAFAPRLLTFQPRDGVTRLVAVNDTDARWSETLTFTRMALDGTELAVATAHLSARARDAVTIEAPAHVLAVGDAAGEVLVADAGYPGDAEHVRAVWTFAEDKDVAYEAAPFAASARAVDGGVEIAVRASGFVRDLTVLADKVDPAAVADAALLTLVPGDFAVVRIATDAGADPEAFLAPNVLVSVNSLVAGARGQ